VSGSFRQRVRAGEPLLGIFLQFGCALATEIVGQAGFDWALVDLEHGAGEDSLTSQLQALSIGGIAALVRVESGERLRIGRALDTGAVGIMVPRVGGAEQAATIVRYLRYPPDGVRGVALGTRAAAFGRVSLVDVTLMNEAVVGIVQIETREAVEAVEAIAAVDGVDVLFVGPADLSLALGVPGQLDHADYQQALQRILAAARRHGKVVGTLLRTARDVEPALRQGMTFLGIGSEATVLASGVRAVARDARAAASGAAAGA
jgi:2-dehydro-3-deoxyglucarate aldolase/4-hydroxy-2-oxoheptanedioate aldolase